MVDETMVDIEGLNTPKAEPMHVMIKTLKRSMVLSSWIIAMGMIGSVQHAMANSQPIIVQSTTSTQNSGLYQHILPIYENQTGEKIRIIAVGTGQAIKNAKNCDGDVLLVHSKADEHTFVNDGFGIKRYDVMYNDFVIIGPKEDPAKLSQVKTATEALSAIANQQLKFISRGDDSGTHKAEMRYWKKTAIDPNLGSGQWYLETGQGMGGTLNITVELGGYTISDRSTWLSFGNKGHHDIVFEGDADLFNQYGIIVIHPDHCPLAQTERAKKFATWIISDKGQNAIASFRVQGQQLFFPNALSD